MGLLAQMGGNSDFLDRKYKLEAELEHLERYGYKTKLLDEDRKAGWKMRCPDCNRRGLLHLAREFDDKKGVYSLLAWLFCVDCAWNSPV